MQGGSVHKTRATKAQEAEENTIEQQNREIKEWAQCEGLVSEHAVREGLEAEGCSLGYRS